MARYHRKRKSMKGGDDGTGPGTTPPETKGYSNGATNPNEDAANAATADNDNLNNLNNIQQNGGRCKSCGHKQHGGNAPDGQVKAVSVDSPVRETAAGPYSSQNQVTANQQVANQGAENTKYDNPGPAPQGGGKRRRKSRKSTRKKSKSKKSMKKRRGRKTIKKSRSRRSRR
jgi:hypothetical protein